MECFDARHESFLKGRPAWPFKRLKEQKQYIVKLARSGWYLSKGPTTCQCSACNAKRTTFAVNDDPFEGHAKTCFLADVWRILEMGDKYSAQCADARANTFAHGWPLKGQEGCDSLASDKMAAAGFIYYPVTDAPDTVLCPYCQLSLDGWDPTDDPIKEHLKRQPNCEFFQPPKPKEEVKASTAPPKKGVARPLKRALIGKAVPAKSTVEPPSRARSKKVVAPEKVVEPVAEVESQAPSAAAERGKRKRGVEAHASAKNAEEVPVVEKKRRAPVEAVPVVEAEVTEPAIEAENNDQAVIERADETATPMQVDEDDIGGAPPMRRSAAMETIHPDPPIARAAEPAGPARPRRERAKAICYAEDTVDLDGKPKVKKARLAKTVVAGTDASSASQEPVETIQSQSQSQGSIGAFEAPSRRSGTIVTVEIPMRHDRLASSSSAGSARSDGSTDKSNTGKTQNRAAKAKALQKADKMDVVEVTEEPETLEVEPPRTTKARVGRTRTAVSPPPVSVAIDEEQPQQTAKPTRSKAAGARPAARRAARAEEVTAIHEGRSDEMDVDALNVDSPSQMSQVNDGAAPSPTRDIVATHPSTLKTAPTTRTNPPSPGLVPQLTIPLLQPLTSTSNPADLHITSAEAKMTVADYFPMEADRVKNEFLKRREEAWRRVEEEFGKLRRWIESRPDAVGGSEGRWVGGRAELARSR
ncbi:uncharacterized protein EV422DRAFT_93620 [Fimicolochytrium jonesii]|uniref:uncharacterized protein n=1 Tax=Fimicolochytrium jonesii TaxID=1396493 RepID=UPI0022FDB64F|nr:uncharacterized protein EV422DRAFT_93620 [Fimicolochytrium jonesii]KAI8819967.1 hypothetical protein EV422DRAFT_93620 [Fimicolochytrium jonesii]